MSLKKLLSSYPTQIQLAFLFKMHQNNWTQIFLLFTKASFVLKNLKNSEVI